MKCDQKLPKLISEFECPLPKPVLYTNPLLDISSIELPSIEFMGIKIVSNPAVPENTIIVENPTEEMRRIIKLYNDENSSKENQELS